MNPRFGAQMNGCREKLFTETEDNSVGYFREENQDCKRQLESP